MNVPEWSGVIAEPLKKVYSALVAYIPNLVGALALAVMGWVVARILRTIVFRVSTFGVERLKYRQALQSNLRQSATMKNAPLVISRFVYWIVLLFFFAAMVETLGLNVVSSIVTDIMTYLPRVLAATAVFFIGVLLGDLAREGVSRAAERAGFALSEVLGRSLQVLILILAAMIAVDHLGIASTVLTIATSVALAATLGAGALAFAMGAKTTVSNIIAVYYLSKSFNPGDLVEIGGIKGCILNITQTSVILDTNMGKTLVPAHRFSEEVSVILAKEE